jgi:hypothetical protein
MKKALALAFGLMVLSAPAVVCSAEDVSSGKLLTYVEFSSIPENRAIPKRLLDKRFEDYRNGWFAVSTLETERMR